VARSVGMKQGDGVSESGCGARGRVRCEKVECVG